VIFFIFFYVLNFGVIFYTPWICVYVELKKDSSSFYNFKFCHIILRHRAGLTTSYFKLSRAIRFNFATRIIQNSNLI
jgi:hypothetical protein